MSELNRHDDDEIIWILGSLHQNLRAQLIQRCIDEGLVNRAEEQDEIEPAQLEEILPRFWFGLPKTPIIVGLEERRRLQFIPHPGRRITDQKAKPDKPDKSRTGSLEALLKSLIAYLLLILLFIGWVSGTYYQIYSVILQSSRAIGEQSTRDVVVVCGFFIAWGIPLCLMINLSQMFTRQLKRAFAGYGIKSKVVAGTEEG